MALEEYRRRRDFRKTPEPAGAARRTPARDGLSYVIQKHAARRLHYDFRLELDGVLKSWAIPKGPSLDPAEKRLAVEVEDHPIEYGGFEGVIPADEYGGGTVLLWDRGTWEPEATDPAAAVHDGMLKFALHGEKLHGNWMLVRLKRKPRDRHDNWLLVKERDAAAIPGSGSRVIDELSLSVDSERSIDAIAAERDRVWHSKSAENPGEQLPAAPKKLRPAGRIAGARKAAPPDKPRPQLATAAATAPEGAEWLHEIKYDGYRLIARIEAGKVRLITRGGLDWTAKFPALARRLAALPVKSAILDGELVALRPDGTTSFADLQDAIANNRTDGLIYFAFDLLYRDGWDLTGAALIDRKRAFAELLPGDGHGMVRYSDHQEGHGPEFLRHAAAYGLEGIVSKRRDSPYSGRRGRNWLKIKSRNRDEFIVVGFTDPEGTREGLGALLLGYHDPDGTLRYAGRVGTGFTAAQLGQLRARLDGIAVRKAPIALPKGDSRKGVHWVRPELVAEVEYAGWTGDALIRHATFQGRRDDKAPGDVVYDPAVQAAAAPPDPPAAPAASTPAAAVPGERLRDGSVVVHGVRLSHPDRVLYPDPGLSKLAAAEYYVAVADWALPHLARRPLTLIRDTGAKGQKMFYQKHVGAGMPDEIRSVEIAGDDGVKPFPYVEDAAGLVALVQIGAVEIHPWGAPVADVERPDRITFDLDPDEGLPWPQVGEAAVIVREALESIGLESWVKTTGGKGLHVVAPLRPLLEWEKVKAFCKWVADRLAERFTDRFTANPLKRERRGRVYLDYLRNSRGATAVGAYSPRARPGTPVSTPVSWDELAAGIDPHDFTVATVPKRLAGLKTDPWAGIGTSRQSLSARVRRAVGI